MCSQRIIRSVPVQKSGFTIVELLCVIAIIGTLMGMVLPAVQQVRESARDVQCKNNIRQISLGLHTYQSAHGRIPPGTLGFDGPVNITSNEFLTINSDPDNPYYFRLQQQTSWIVHVLPFIDQETLFRKLPKICTAINSDYESWRAANPGAPQWLDGFPEVRDVSSTVILTLLCPSDSIENVSTNAPFPMLVGVMPGFLTDIDFDGLFGVPVAEFDLDPAPTNYLGCAGAYSGGDLPDDIHQSLDSMRKFKGVFGSRRSVNLPAIGDGSSNTIMIGESIGYIENGIRSSPQSWFFGGLFRGSSGLGWEADHSASYPGLELIGDNWYAYPAGLGSMHPTHANIGNADGSVQSVSRSIDWQVLYSRCGANDGIVIKND